MRVAIIDYGSGNLRSATKAFERAAREAGIDAQIDVFEDRQVPEVFRHRFEFDHAHSKRILFSTSRSTSVSR